jgi:hypothetical protein
VTTFDFTAADSTAQQGDISLNLHAQEHHNPHVRKLNRVIRCRKARHSVFTHSMAGGCDLATSAADGRGFCQVRLCLAAGASLGCNPSCVTLAGIFASLSATLRGEWSAQH